MTFRYPCSPRDSRSLARVFGALPRPRPGNGRAHRFLERGISARAAVRSAACRAAFGWHGRKAPGEIGEGRLPIHAIRQAGDTAQLESLFSWDRLDGGTVPFLFGRLGARFALARILFGCTASVLGLALGLIGLILVCLWAFTNHKAAHANANIMQLAPWALLLVGYGIGVALRRENSIRKARGVALSAFAFSAAGIAGKVLPGLNQDNWPFILLFFPVWLGLWAGLRELSRRHSQPG